MKEVMGYEIYVGSPITRDGSGVTHIVMMRARHIGGAARNYKAVFTIENGRLRKTGDSDIPLVIFEMMRRQAAAILRENRGISKRGRHDKRRSPARLRQEEIADEKMKEDLFD